MPLPEICTEAEVAELVTVLDAKARDDALLGPIFERHVADWNLHLPKMIGKRSASDRRVAMTVRSLIDAGVPTPTARAAPSLRAFLEFVFRPLYPAADFGRFAPLLIRPRS